ncbi:hypothetical protein NSMM_310006 [Nitrosomonas mobilis]|uniref:Uncharacterized protein n=1 Tax=Nitrosomonas mobilis TaxID=51642 RepID=A0A1G5SCJ9_9PROT|nr:hypothetical protein NSMM_310006 [Nitrosomonas mobilis]
MPFRDYRFSKPNRDINPSLQSVVMLMPVNLYREIFLSYDGGFRCVYKALA